MLQQFLCSDPTRDTKVYLYTAAFTLLKFERRLAINNFLQTTITKIVPPRRVILLNIKREERDSLMHKQTRRKTVMNVTDRGMWFSAHQKTLLS